jgi:hypothetical protein
MRLIMLLLLIGALGCDRVVSSTQSASYVDTRTVSCTHTSYCFSCVGFGGTGCGFKLSPACPGRQAASVRVTPERVVYESGAEQTGERIDVLERIGTCR